MDLWRCSKTNMCEALTRDGAYRQLTFSAHVAKYLQPTPWRREDKGRQRWTAPTNTRSHQSLVPSASSDSVFVRHTVRFGGCHLHPPPQRIEPHQGALFHCHQQLFSPNHVHRSWLQIHASGSPVDGPSLTSQFPRIYNTRKEFGMFRQHLALSSCDCLHQPSSTVISSPPLASTRVVLGRLFCSTLLLLLNFAYISWKTRPICRSICTPPSSSTNSFLYLRASHETPNQRLPTSPRSLA